MKRISVFILILFMFLCISADAFGTGWLINDPAQTKHMKLNNSIQPSKALPERVINTGGLPPVGNQQSQGSCTAWATAYYYKTYQEWQEHGWDVTDTEHRFSPSFIYNQINGNEDGGSYVTDAFLLLEESGVVPYAFMTYDQNDFTSWPDMGDYYKAANYRTQTSYYTSLGNLDLLKQHLADGNIAVFGIYVWGNFDNISSYNNVYCVADSTGTNRGGHVVTVIGYDDTMTTNDGTGAFRCVNSWGTSWGQAGYWWISYTAMNNTNFVPSQYFYWADDKQWYSPELYASARFTHGKEDIPQITFGTGSPSSPHASYTPWDFYMDWAKQYFSYPDSVAFPSHNIIFDITDIKPTINDTIFVTFNDSVTDATSGQITDFRVFDSSMDSFVSSDTPVNVSDNGSGTAKLYRTVTAVRPVVSLSDDSIIYNYTTKSSKGNVEVLEPVSISGFPITGESRYTNIESSYWKGTLDTLQDYTDYSFNFYGVNYWGVRFNVAQACSLRDVFWGRSITTAQTDTMKVNADNAGNPGTELYRYATTVNTPGSTTYHLGLASGPYIPAGYFWIVFYAYSANGTEYFGADNDGGGTTSYISGDGSSFSNLASQLVYNDLAISAVVEYATTAVNDTQTVYILNTDAASSADFIINYAYLKDNASWISSFSIDDSVAYLGDSVGIKISVDTVGLNQNSAYTDTIVVMSAADSLAKSEVIKIPVKVYMPGYNMGIIDEPVKPVDKEHAYSVFPNPCRDNCTIMLELERSENVSVQIFDVTGRLVRDLVYADMDAGRNYITWNGKDNDSRNTSSGMYFIRLRNGNNSNILKLMKF